MNRTRFDRTAGAPVPTAGGSPEVSRRNIAALLGTALGASALTACASRAGATEVTAGVAQLLPSGGSFVTVDTIDDLRALAPQGVALVLGYFAPGDGGGGIFHGVDDKTSPDDGGIVVVPRSKNADAGADAGIGACVDGGAPPADAERTGCWKRVVTGAIDVRWFGAKGDGKTSDRVAIQRAIDAAAGGFPSPVGSVVTFPPGRYVIDVPACQGYGLLVKQTLTLVGSGGAPAAAANPTVLLAQGDGDVLLIESDASTVPNAYYTRVNGLAIYPADLGGTANGNGIVVHASYVQIEDCVIVGMKKNGILIESAGPQEGNPPEGATALPRTANVMADFWRVSNVFLDGCGNGVRVHGADANGGLGTMISTFDCGYGIDDATIGGAAWIACYAQGTPGQGTISGFRNRSGGGGVYVNCFSETAPTFGDFTEAAGPKAVIVGNAFGGQVLGATGRLKVFRNPGPAVNQYPNHGAGSIQWTLAYDEQSAVQKYDANQPNYPLQQSYYWSLQNPDPTAPVPPWSPSQITPFAWTDSGHPRGVGMPYFGAPLFNSHRRWSVKLRQIVLQPGLNRVVLYAPPGQNLNTAYFENGSYALTWLNDPSQGSSGAAFPSADARLAVEIELAAADIATAPAISVGAHAFSTPVPAWNYARNAMVQIVNHGTAPVTVTVVWHFEAFVTRADQLAGAAGGTAP